MDIQLAIFVTIDANVLFRQVLAVCTADDIEGVVQLLGNNLRCIVLCIIAGILHAVFHGGYLVFTSLVGVDDTSNAIFAVNAVGSVDAFILIIVAVLNGDINSVSAILAVGAGRACEADMADTVFTENGNGVLAIFAGDANLTVDTILTGFALRAGDGNTIFARCTIFTVETADRDAIGAVQADMAIFAVDADLAVFTVLARFADVDILRQLQIIGDLASRSICGFMEQDVLASIDIFVRLSILAFTGWSITFYSQGCMGTCCCADRLQSRIKGFQVLPG